jgi:hypothetical protein
MYLVIEYENNDIPQDLNVVFESENLDEARKNAYELARRIYGVYVEDFKKIKDHKIKNNYMNSNKSLYDYSDWSINFDGTFDNIIFSVIDSENLKYFF